jgi:uncharacterized protein (TIGR03067 family)
VSIETDGQQAADGAGAKFVFTEDTMDVGGIPNWYRLDPTKEPKHLDFNTEGLQKPHRAIYRLEGDTLTICFATIAGEPRPTKFTTTPDDGTQMVICEQAKAVAGGSANVEFEPSLQKAIDEAIELLEGNQIEEYLERFVPADELRSLKQSDWEETVEYVGSQRTAFLNTFHALPKMKPVMNDSQTEAVFDLSQVHIDNGVPFPRITFVKTNGKWCFVNR